MSRANVAPANVAQDGETQRSAKPKGMQSPKE